MCCWLVDEEDKKNRSMIFAEGWSECTTNDSYALRIL